MILGKTIKIDTMYIHMALYWAAVTWANFCLSGCYINRKLGNVVHVAGDFLSSLSLSKTILQL